MRVSLDHLRAWIARPVRMAASAFPGWKLLGHAADRLSFVRSVYGVRIFNTPGDRTFELCRRGYGPFVADAIRNRTDPFLFLDIGANLGLFSLLAARNPSCTGVIAFEPIPEIFSRLELNIAHNRADKVRPIMGAITDHDAPLVHLTFSDRHSGMSKIVPAGDGVRTAPVVNAEQLDDLVPRMGPEIFAKIDVEGAETNVLSALRRTHFHARLTEIVIEVSRANLGEERWRELPRMLRQDGYREIDRSGSPDHYDALYHHRRVNNATPSDRPAAKHRHAPERP